jgi:GT2 family glycosyltransferase
MDNISFCINTSVNELDHIKLLFKSLKINLSSKEHEILVFIDSDNQNTFEWLLTQKHIFPNLKILKNHLPICYGYARNINEMFKLASNQIVSYLQSDMVVCKNYDLELLKRIEPNMVLCSTRIEPPLHGNSGEKITYNFGLDPLQFDLTQFTEYAETQKQDKTIEYFFAPFTMYKEVWNSIGGHDTQFRRSREDSDILTRLILNDTKIIQTWSALVYHFTCVSSRGVNWFDSTKTETQTRKIKQQQADEIELRRFIQKWGKFFHSTEKPFYYKINANILGDISNMLAFLRVQSYFNEVFIEEESLIDSLQSIFKDDHIVANELLNIPNNIWEEYNYLYNQIKATDRIKSLNESKGDIIVTFKLKDINNDNFNHVINNLQDIIHNTELGEFEYDYFYFNITKKTNSALEKIVITNPEIKKEHLYKIF